VVTVGVDLGGTYISVVVLDGEDQQLGWSRMKTPAGGERNEVLEVMEAAVHAGLGDADLEIGDVEAMGVSTPGVVIDGTVGNAANVPGWQERFSLKEGLEGRMDATVRVVNDVSAAAVAEHRLGAAAGHDDVLVVFVGTGVGAGLILGGEPYEGAFGGAGEFGHTVVAMNGNVCPCGRRGCVEAYAGRRALEMSVERAVNSGVDTVVPALVEKQDKSQVTNEVIRDALALGDPLTADLVDQAVEALGAGIASAVNLVDVEVVVVGGRLVDQLGPSFIRRVEAAMWPSLFLVPARVEVVPAALGGDSGALGAAIVARG
jgi:glucokinase